MKNRAFYFISAVCVIALAAISFSFTNNTTPIQPTTTDQPVESFKNISVAGCWDVYISNAPTSTIRMEGDQSEIDKIDVSVKNESLQIKLKKDNMSCSGKVKIYVSTTTLQDISLGGSGMIRLENKFSNTGSMNFSLSGSGSIEGDVSSPDIDIDIAGSGKIDLNGDTKNLDIDIAGSGNFDGQELTADKADVDVAGSGDAHVKVNSNLDVEIAGSGDVYYIGDPAITKEIAGSGDVIKN